MIIEQYDHILRFRFTSQNRPEIFHLEELGLITSRKLFMGIRSIVIDLTAKGKHLMHGKPAPRKKSEKLGLSYTHNPPHER